MPPHLIQVNFKSIHSYFFIGPMKLNSLDPTAEKVVETVLFHPLAEGVFVATHKKECDIMTAIKRFSLIPDF